MDNELLERLVIAFERLADSQEQQSEYLMEIKTQHANQYTKYDQWREFDERINTDAGQRKEREVSLVELRFELEMALLKFQAEHAGVEAAPVTSKLLDYIDQMGI